ncbi:MAG: N-formylglutamate amidohydrolase [Betaproteobacteria bacterium]|nr:N-formylglutamate amidohydrolase [Betaproteobacteria bacterium]
MDDFRVGGRGESTCEPGSVDVVERSLLARRYFVARNDTFKGLAVLAQIGQPSRNRISL